MTNKQYIQQAGIIELAEFLHKMQAGALIEGRADSVETLIEFLDEEDESEVQDDDEH